MDPHSFIARAEAQRWLGIAEKLLTDHDLIGAKTFAIRARESDPRLEGTDQILAIADTLLAAEKRVVGSNGTQQPDYYAILQLVRFVQDTEQISDQYRRLAVTLNPHRNRFSYSDQAFRVVNDAWSVLSNPLRKSMYDSELDFQNHIGFNLEHDHHHQQHQHQNQNQHQNQQQHQHNFFSINRMGSGNEHELAEQQPTFQTRVQRNHHQQHSFLSHPNPVRPSPVGEQEELFHSQVQPFQITSTPPQQQSRPPTQPTPPPATSPQPPPSWPQAPPHSQFQQPPMPTSLPPAASPLPQASGSQPPAESQPQPCIRSATPPSPAAPPQPPVSSLQAPPHSQPQQEQQVSPEQNSTPVQPSTQVDTDKGVNFEENETVTEEDCENVDSSPTFWTACPYCLYMYEYPRVYAECTLRCTNCERAFQAVPIPSPPPIIEDQEAYFCCWGSIPVAISLPHLDINRNWTSISPLYDVSSQIHDRSNSTPVKQNRNWEPRVYKDDVTDDIFTEVSEPSDDSDVDWNGNENKKVRKVKKRGRKRKGKGLDVKTRRKTNKNVEDSAESSKKQLVGRPRRQSGRVAKEMGKLDLNVEFNNRGQGQGEEDNVEGNGFFEGLDEFLSSLPILSVVNDEKAKAS